MVDRTRLAEFDAKIRSIGTHSDQLQASIDVIQDSRKTTADTVYDTEDF